MIVEENRCYANRLGLWLKAKVLDARAEASSQKGLTNAKSLAVSRGLMSPMATRGLPDPTRICGFG